MPKLVSGKVFLLVLDGWLFPAGSPHGGRGLCSPSGPSEKALIPLYSLHLKIQPPHFTHELSHMAN